MTGTPSLPFSSSESCELCGTELLPHNTGSLCAECALVLANEGSDERWRTYPGWPSWEVSDYGRVRRVVKQSRSEGYPSVTLRERGRPAKRVRVHTMVLEAFRGPRPPGLEALHGDDCETNNRLTNLRWGTRTENLADRRRIVAERLMLLGKYTEEE